MPGVESQTHNWKTVAKTDAVLATLVGTSFTIKIIDATVSVPNNMILFRDDVFVSELHMLSPDELLTSNDRFGIHVLIFENRTERLVGATHVAPAEQILFMHYAGFDSRELSTSVLSRFSAIAKEFRGQGLLRLALSIAANFFVRRGRSNVITYLQEPAILQQTSTHLFPVADGVARTEHLRSGQSRTLKPYFILFEDLLNLEVKRSKHFQDLLIEIQCFDWFTPQTSKAVSFKLQHHDFGLDGK